MDAWRRFGIHWGTFRLTDEARTARVAALATRGLDPARFVAADAGVSYPLGAGPRSD